MSSTDKRTPRTPEELAESAALKALFDSKKASLGLTQEKAAADIGITQGSLNNYLSGRNALNAKAAADIARLIGVHVDDFSDRLAAEIRSMHSTVRPLKATATAPTVISLPVARRLTPAEMEEPFNKENYVFIEQSSARLAAGHGEDNTHVEVRGELAFKKEWIKRKGLQVESLIVAYASGRSMEPLIHDQDAILINTAADTLKHDCVFYFRNAEHEAIIKRAMKVDGEWILRSDNPDKSVKEHQDMPFVDEHGQQRFEVIGAARWRGGDL